MENKDERRGQSIRESGDVGRPVVLQNSDLSELFINLATVRHTPSTETDAPVTKPSVVMEQKSMTKRITSSPVILEILPVPATMPVNIISPQIIEFYSMKVLKF